MKIIITLAVVALSLGAPDRPRAGYAPPAVYRPSPSYTPAPTYAPAPSYRPAPSYEAPAKYDFDWAVKDDYSGNDFGHQESRDGDYTQGSYYVQLPDGRRQKVTYYVNGDSGYVAEVSYEGEARYAARRPSYSPSPSYNPAPVYTPAPVYG
ncbi:cuticle protein 7-like [Penaeus japonicus]|uniref:cuticle protein 7-like n=1 Tax=Penaeus japonicus TaxID=27405 RepID=UPI001C711CF3|nr:cuticle protein 7-like [Penaeus japonicus]